MRSSTLKMYLHPYYIINTLLVLVYPVHRYLGVDSVFLHQKDWLGYSREMTIVGTFVLFVLLRYKKYCTLQHAIVTILLYAKACVLGLYGHIHLRFVLIYLFLSIRTMQN